MTSHYRNYDVEIIVATQAVASAAAITTRVEE